MKRAIGKRVRDEAIEALLCCADDRMTGGSLTTRWLLGFGAADIIGDEAWKATGGPATFGVIGGRDPQTRYLEAAGLLIDGWSPGEAVVRLGGAS